MNLVKKYRVWKMDIMWGMLNDPDCKWGAIRTDSEPSLIEVLIYKYQFNKKYGKR